MADVKVSEELANKFAEFESGTEFNRPIERSLRIDETESRANPLESDVTLGGRFCAAYREQQTGSDEDHNYGRSGVHILFPYLR